MNTVGLLLRAGVRAGRHLFPLALPQLQRAHRPNCTNSGTALAH